MSIADWISFLMKACDFMLTLFTKTIMSKFREVQAPDFYSVRPQSRYIVCYDKLIIVHGYDIYEYDKLLQGKYLGKLYFKKYISGIKNIHKFHWDMCSRHALEVGRWVNADKENWVERLYYHIDTDIYAIDDIYTVYLYISFYKKWAQYRSSKDDKCAFLGSHSKITGKGWSESYHKLLGPFSDKSTVSGRPPYYATLIGNPANMSKDKFVSAARMFVGRCKKMKPNQNALCDITIKTFI